MRARQLRKYFPEIQFMARLQNQIINILGRKDSTADEKLSMINSSDSRFSKLRRQTQILPAITLPSQVKHETKIDNHEQNNQDLTNQHDAINNPEPDKATFAVLNKI